MRRDVLLAIAFGVLLIATGFVIGWRWQADAHKGWEQDRATVLADKADVERDNARLASAIDTLGRSVAEYADRVARQDARIAVERRDANTAKAALQAYRDTVTAELIPVVQLDNAFAVIRQQEEVIVAQAEGIALRDRQIQAGAELRAKVEAQRDLWVGRAGELEQVLSDYRAKPKPTILGILPAPSPTVALLAGVIAGVVLW